MRRRRALVVAAVALAVATGCSGDDDAAVTTTAPELPTETTLAEPPSCSRLSGTVDLAALEEAGCLSEEGVVAIPTVMECPGSDETIVFIEDRMGRDGGEWVAVAEDWEQLCS